MSGDGRLSLSRRAFAGLLLQTAALWGGRAAAQDPNAADRGLGGTGVAPVDPNETLGQDRGIGGTGVIGTIRRFGSILVNDLRVTFRRDVKVSIDGRPATLADLKVGHVVRVLARPRRGGLATRAIVAQSEVVGPAEALSAEGDVVVLGQRVMLPEGVTLPAHRLGDLLAVSGLRRIDGTIVASLVERRPAGPSRLHGPVEPDADGAPAIGTLRIDGLAPALIGQRVSLVGTRQGDVFRARSVTVEPTVPFAAADSLSVEAYVALTPDGLRLGSGLDMAAGSVPLSALAADENVRAVVTARPGPSGRLDAESLRVEHESRGSGRSGDHPGVPDGAGRPGRPGGPDGAIGPSGPISGGRGDGPGSGPGGVRGGFGGGGSPGGGPSGGGPGVNGPGR